VDIEFREAWSLRCDYLFEIWDELKVTPFQAHGPEASDLYQIAELLLS